MKIVHLRNQL